MSDHDLNETEIGSKSLPSFSFFPVLLLAGGIFLAGPFIGKITVTLLYVLLLIGILYEMLSKSSFVKMKTTYPEMDRRYWMTNCFIFHLVVPALIAGGALLLVRFLL